MHTIYYLKALLKPKLLPPFQIFDTLGLYITIFLFFKYIIFLFNLILFIIIYLPLELLSHPHHLNFPKMNLKKVTLLFILKFTFYAKENYIFIKIIFFFTIKSSFDLLYLSNIFNN